MMEQKIAIGFVIAVCLMWQANAASVNCTSTGPGRFADTDDTTCQNYTYCVYDSSTSTYLSYNYVCPTTSVFNPNTHQCTDSSNYVCNATTSVCTSDGYIADPSSTNCTTYIECVEVDGSFIETTYTCPDDTYYNPNTTYCESDYNCTSTDTTTFTCTAAGRFADSTDTTCQNYYLCVLSGTTYIEYTYTCPSTSVFNPNTSVCTTSYTCTN